MRLAPVATILAGTALAVAGCGGGGGKGNVQSTLHTYIGAFVNGDGKKACAQLTKETQQQIVVQLAARLGGKRDCPTAIVRLGKLLGPAALKAFRTTKITDIRVNGDSAIAALSAAGNTSTTRLLKVNGDWKIAAVPGSG